MDKMNKAKELLREFKGAAYIYGLNVLQQCGTLVADLGAGQTAVLVTETFPGIDAHIEIVTNSLNSAGITVGATIPGAQPNAPREDLQRITESIRNAKPDLVVSVGGGSTIDAAKAAIVLTSLGGDIEDYFGVGLVTARIENTGRSLIPHLAIQTAASSGAHLTKYSNITDVSTGQKKLIVDEAIVPQRAVFDYSVTTNAPESLIADGAIDGIAHSLEVLYSSVGKPNYNTIENIALTSIELIVENLPLALRDRNDQKAFEALGLGTDLGGYAIMLGGTNGAHLTSFSLVDVLSHGRACGIMNPYYTVFFAPAIQEPLHKLADIFKTAGYLTADEKASTPRELGMQVAKSMIQFIKEVGIPTALSDVSGFSDAHIERALKAAKNPQLKMKLENMPVPMTADMVDEYMGAILQAAKSGNLELIKNYDAATV